jgi:hypothetical protein
MKKHWLIIGSTSLLVLAGITVTGVIAKEKEEENEVKMAFKDVPAIVQKTIQREAFGAAINSVDKEKDDGKTVYEADAKIDGHNYEIKVGEDGVLLKKKLDDDEKDEKDEKDAKDKTK